MPVWYLVASAVVGLLVLAGVAYAELKARRGYSSEPVFAGEFDVAVADAPTRREAETVFERRERAGAEQTTARGT